MKNRIAIRVSNKREFDALMQHYESKGWVNTFGEPAIQTQYRYNGKNTRENVSYVNSFSSYDEAIVKEYHDEVIDFSTFAQIAGIEVKDEIDVQITSLITASVTASGVSFNNPVRWLDAQDIEPIYAAYQSLQ